MAAAFDSFETMDGSRPESFGLSSELQRQFPIGAFALLESGDAFEHSAATGAASSNGDGLHWAQTCVARFELKGPHWTQAWESRVRQDMTRQLSGNVALARRLLSARPLAVELLADNEPWVARGFPKAVASNTAGLFWDHPTWPAARVAFRSSRLDKDRHLVFHEFAHSVAFLAFTQEERALLARRFLRTYRHEAWVDEAFAIYSEREFVGTYEQEDERAPGIYGHARRRWSEDHLLTRFVRALYFPDKPLAGPLFKAAQTLG